MRLLGNGDGVDDDDDSDELLTGGVVLVKADTGEEKDGQIVNTKHTAPLSLLPIHHGFPSSPSLIPSTYVREKKAMFMTGVEVVPSVLEAIIVK